MNRAFAKFFIISLAVVALASDASAAVGSGANAAPTNAEIDQALKALKTRSPDRYRRMSEIRESEPERFMQNVLQVVREEERLARVKKTVPENHTLQIAMWNNREKLRYLVEEFRSENDSAGRQIIESQIDNLLGEQFELRRQMRMNRLKLAEKKLAELRAGLRRDPAGEKNRFVAEWKPKLIPGNSDANPAAVRAAAPVRTRKVATQSQTQRQPRMLPARPKAAATPIIEDEETLEE